MKVLILSCNTGEGHNSAARAVKEKFDNAKIVCEIADSLEFLSPKASTFISKWHVRLYKKAPILFGIGYKAAEITAPSKRERSMLYEIMAKGAKKLRKKIEETGCDTVICTHTFAAMMLTKAVLKYKLEIKSYFVSTDYTCSPGVKESKLDYYFIAHEKIRDEFIQRKIPNEKIVVSGIPVSSRFSLQKSKAESRAELGLPENKKTAVLMCGSMGCGPIKFIARTLYETIDENEFLVVICGSNKKLFRSLKKYNSDGRVRVIGYTRNMPDYMNAADLIITKPGGLSTSEAATNNLPMILIDAVSGCETYNMNFWVGNNMAQTAEKSRDICALVHEVLGSEEKIGEMKQTLSENFESDAAGKIFEFITNVK